MIGYRSTLFSGDRLDYKLITGLRYFVTFQIL